MQETDRNKLIEENISYAEAIAKSMRTNVPYNIDMDEIISFAKLGLVQAAKKYDPSKKVAFKTFAYYRIRGAIFDGVRALSSLPRRELEKLKFIKGADFYFQQQVESSTIPRTSTKPLSEQQFNEMISVMSTIYIISMDSTQHKLFIEDNKNMDPEQTMEQSESAKLLKKILQSLNVEERKLIKMYYWENKTLDEIGKALKLSKSWVCRMHSKILKKLGKLIQHDLAIDHNSIRV